MKKMYSTLYMTEGDLLFGVLLRWWETCCYSVLRSLQAHKQ